MKTKHLVLAISVAVLILGSIDATAGSYARWYGNTIAATVARTVVPGAAPPGCYDTKVYPFNWFTLPVSSFCLTTRIPVTNGGAWAYGFCDTTATGVRRARSASGTWGFWTFAGKAMGDTARCSTEVNITMNGGSFDVDIYAELESRDPLQTAIVQLQAKAEGAVLFSGLVRLKGDTDGLETEGEFTPGDFVVIENQAVMERSFPGIDLQGHPPESLLVQVNTDAVPHYPVPATSQYGLYALLLMIMAAGGYLIYRRRLQAE